ncbi:MAG: nucleoside deaminase [Aureispira sp.]|nr:nucleoside deaminase [Aureispira sp.]
MFSVFSHEYYMKEALKEAQKAYEADEVPVGAVVVCQNKIIARSHNQTERLQDVTAHAELLAVTAAADYLGNKYLQQCTLYVTLEPCVMCAGALSWAQLGSLVYGASDEKRGYHEQAPKALHPKTTILYGVLELECKHLMKSFFKKKRK